jgi:hypothetical protein
MPMTEPIIGWSAPEHYHYEKSSDWYWAVGIITATAAVLAFIFGQIIFGIFIIVAAVTLCLHAATNPRLVRYEINDRGIVVNNVLYPFLSLESFWIDTLHPEPKILIKSQKMFMPIISVPIEEVDPEDVRTILLHYIAETEHIEPFTQKLLEVLGF